MSQEDNNVSTNIETSTTTVDNTLNETPKTKNNKIVPIVIVVLAVLVILGGGFYYYFSKPSIIVTNVINTAYKEFSNILKDSSEYNIEEDSMIMSGDLTIDTNIDGLEDLKNEDIDYRIGLDYSNKKVEAGIALTEDKTKIINAILYVLNDNVYVSLKDDYDKIINIDNEEIDFSDVFDIESVNINNDDIDYIVKEFKNILIDSIDMDELEKSTDTIKVDGKNQKVNKVTYDLNAKNMKNFVNKFVDKTLENKDLLKKLSEISGTDIDEIKDSLKNAKDGDFEDAGKLNIYTKGFTSKFVKLEFLADDIDFGIVANKDNTEIYAKEDSTNITFVINEYNEEEINIDYNVNAGSEKITGNITVTSEEVKDNKYEGKISFELKYNDYNFSIKSNYNLEIGAKVADINTKNAVKYSEIDTEFNNILLNISTRLEESNLYNIIENLIPSSSYDDYDTTYDYDYEYDFDDTTDYDIEYDFSY